MKLIKKNEEYILLGEKIGNSDKTPLVDFTPTVKINGSWHIALATNKKHLKTLLIDEKQVSELIEAIEIDRIEKLADKYADKKMDMGQGFDLVSGWRKLFKEGYTQALEDNSEKKFSLNQTFAICRLMFSNDYKPRSEDSDERFKEFQESFNKISSHFLKREQKNEWEAEVEMEDAVYSHKDCGNCNATGSFGNINCSECKGYGSTMTTVSESKPKVNEQGYINIIKIK